MGPNQSFRSSLPTENLICALPPQRSITLVSCWSSSDHRPSGFNLLPALNKARMQAAMVKCQSNMRQIAMAVNIYAGENKAQLPFCNWGGVNDNTVYAYGWLFARPDRRAPYIGDVHGHSGKGGHQRRAMAVHQGHPHLSLPAGRFEQPPWHQRDDQLFDERGAVRVRQAGDRRQQPQCSRPSRTKYGAGRSRADMGGNRARRGQNNKSGAP